MPTLTSVEDAAAGATGGLEAAELDPRRLALRQAPDMASHWPSLYAASKLALWSGFCYSDQPSLEAALGAEGLSLVAYGRTSYTSWYVADGCVDFEGLARRAVPRRGAGRQGPPPGSAPAQSPGNGAGGGGNGAAAGAGRPLSQAVPQSALQGEDGWVGSVASASVPRPAESLASASASYDAGPAGSLRGPRCRFVFFRGVQWSAHDSNALSLSAALAQFWPSQLVPPEAAGVPAGPASSGGPPSAAVAGGNGNGNGGTSRSAAGPSTAAASGGGGAGGSGGWPPSDAQIVAHTGVAGLARQLWAPVFPYIAGASAAGCSHVFLAGHSMGGALAQLLWAQLVLGGHRAPDATSCHTFGSPPVLAHASGGGGARVLRALRAPPGAVVNWVLEHDPVPRAMHSTDPAFAAARGLVPGLSTLLALRGSLLGGGAALSSGRFLYETAGEVLLLRWAEKGGCEAVPVAEADAEAVLGLPLSASLAAPVKTLQHWLDHHHASYHHDLEAAALAACRREAGAGRRGPF
ncbi:hypothetical protein HYH03_011769 [Edaphochlamys debaryana]|uniref:Fungal lipase-type domain-containing protein n=1 Tax=Edaphochlamys debaryana TaxID=47281 RepID=A0A836BUW2_9CHLO|nr:hypothetical protein HYH03_011769 [Edaphochlamys debaryana]|eukprot:KAG2489820.1 hypothetical protein HYH03_011769 [Edaphochlamys debaryana]